MSSQTSWSNAECIWWLWVVMFCQQSLLSYVRQWYQQSHSVYNRYYKGACKSLARPGRKQATATEDFDVHISYL